MLHSSIIKAYSVLEGKELDKSLALELAKLKGEDIVDLISLANKVKHKFAAKNKACSILNAKSGACAENCKYCAQSAHHKAKIDVFPLMSAEQILAEAKKVYENGVRTFGIVTSGTGYLKADDKDFQSILKAIDLIYQNYPDMEVCASIGILSEETAKALADRKIVHFNMNLQVNPKRYKELIADTHSVEDRINTVKLLKKNGIKACTGGIFGVGETIADRVEMAYVLKELDVDVISLNVLIPIQGTPLENQAMSPVSEIIKSYALFRLINPTKVIKFAAGRETRMKDFQGLVMLAGANSILTGGYLTTRGRETSEDQLFFKELEGF